MICAQQRFKTKGVLWKHQRIRHESNKYKCTICAKKFTLESDLVEHESVEHWQFITR